MIKYFTIEDLLKHYLQKKFHILNLSLRNRNDGRPLFLNTCAEFIFRGACNALNFPPGNITERNGFLESLLCMEMKKALESNTKKEYVNTIFI